jgi:DNA-binding LytR/AlgR family response regulator
MRALIVDDEPIARQVLRETLEDFPSIQIAGEASTGPEAVEEIQRLNPDLVFLDLQLPGLDGFAILRSLRPDCIPLVIFVTAYEEHALKAFDAGAIDYLMKPVRRDRLAAAIEKAEARLAGKKTALPSAPRRIVGRLGEELHLLDPSEAIAFQADGELVVIVTARGKYFSNHSLKTLEEKLEYPRFRRIHRKTIINTDHIRTITPLTSKRWLLKMSNGLQVVVSKRLAGAIREETKW